MAETLDAVCFSEHWSVYEYAQDFEYSDSSSHTCSMPAGFLVFLVDIGINGMWGGIERVWR
jgi:hypothetical protein